MGTEDLIPRIITSKAITEVTQYEFSMPFLILTPHNVKLPSQVYYLVGILGLGAIENPLKIVNILEVS